MPRPPADPGTALREGLRSGDLQDMVIPLLSVDEYESKISPDSVVVGFYVRDLDAARDLNRFVQKSPAPLLDTDVSPAPDQRGFYLVFVELASDHHAGEHLKGLLDEVGGLVRIGEWSMRVRRIDRLVPFTPKAFARAVERARRKVVAESAVHGFFQNSDLARLDVRGPAIRAETAIREAITGRVVTIGTPRSVASLTFGEALDLSLAGAARGRRIAHALGEGWTCDLYLSNKIVLSSPSGEQCLIELVTN